MGPKIFLSYRREETRHVSRLIHERLAAAFGKESIFFDVHKLLVGHDFREGINKAVDHSQIMVAVIGRRWLHLLHQREAKRETDWVRYEVERALERGATVVPVLVGGARPLPEGSLPDRLQRLAFANSIPIHDDINFDSDMVLLTEELRKTLRSLGHAVPDRPTGFWDQREGRRRGFLVFLGAAAGLSCFGVWREAWPVAEIDRAALGNLLYSTCWVTYDPSGMTLNEDRQPIYPALSSIETDLDLIRDAGFSGILTSSSDGIMDQVPQAAKRRDLKVIMGIWNPTNRREVSRAISQGRHVDAYCVGHDGYPDRYTLQHLKEAVFLVKKRTGRPAAISEQAKCYNPELARIGDWLFPDAHLTLKADDEDLVANVDLDRDLRVFIRSTEHLAPFAQELGRPLIFKNVAYPYAGVLGGSRARQAEFFRRLLARINDPQRGYSVKVAIVAQGAFDAPWKTEKPFLAWDPYTGLITTKPAGVAAMSPAGREILRWYPHLEAARKNRISQHEPPD
jgi:hypothetical protein